MATGYRHRESGVLTNVGGEGDVWASSSYASGNINAGFLNFNAGNVNPLNNTNRANGLSVRCVQASAGRPLSGSGISAETAFGPGMAEATASVSAVADSAIRWRPSVPLPALYPSLCRSCETPPAHSIQRLS
ncbi:MAG: fibrobacter succinogenes major paralogous domain-containing protein [Alistipes sp.]|nr:fibrobacter succinogenes major paralogous domain-containing protein [Alistipes sp.]